MSSKVCTDCLVEKANSEFSVSQSRCKKCRARRATAANHINGLTKTRLELIPYPYPLEDSSLSKGSLEIYNHALSRLYTEGLTNFDDVEKTLEVVKSITENLNSAKGYLQAILRKYPAHSRASEYRDELKKMYSVLFKDRDKNKELRENEKKYFISWKDLMKVDFSRKEINVKKMLFSLYTKQPPRRVVDYLEMYYVDEEKDIETDKNYCIGGKEFLFNRYKTVASFGVQRISINDELRKIIKRYIQQNAIKDRDKLLGINHAATFTKKVKEAFLELAGKETTVNCLRHSYETFIAKKFPWEEISKHLELMGHSFREATRYQRNQD